MCLSAVIDTWLRRPKGDVTDDVRPTWSSLCEALSHINRPLAETIAGRHHITSIGILSNTLMRCIFQMIFLYFL